LLAPLAPLICLLLPGIVLALVPAARSVTLLLIALVLIVLAVLAVAVQTVAVLLSSLWWLGSVLETSQWKRDRTLTDPYFAEYWSVRLCHITDPGQASEVVRALREHIAKAIELATPPDDGTGGTTLLFRVTGITLPGARAAIRAIAAVISVDSRDSETLLIQDARHRSLPVPEQRPQGGVLLMPLVTAVILLSEARFLADQERAACRLTSCIGHPATYGSALYWEFSQLFFSNPPGLTAMSFEARVIGPETRLLSVVTCVLLGVTFFRYLRWRNKEIPKISEAAKAAMGKTATLVLVANQTERDAVIHSVQKATGGQGVIRRFLDHHTVFDLGVLSASRILLAQSEQGIELPGAMMLTANSLITQCQPDYVILVGICFGLWEQEQQIGDVLVSAQLRNLNWKSVVEKVPGAPEEFIRSDQVSPGVLLDRCRAGTTDWTGPKVHFGVMLSENVLVNSAEYRRSRKDSEPYAIGGEMEGAGLYAAAARNKVDWIIIKGISDWGQHKTSEFREVAAESAADFLVHVIQTGALDQPPGLVGSPGMASAHADGAPEPA
jgi:nucleoside phosphorylase